MIIRRRKIADIKKIIRKKLTKKEITLIKKTDWNLKRRVYIYMCVCV